MVIPVYDDNPFKLPHRPVVTWGLIAANILIYVGEVSSGNGQAIIGAFGLTPAALIGEGSPPAIIPPPVTLVTYMFLHADVAHLLGNMIFLWVFGDNIEQALGRARFLAFYLLCGVAGALVFAASDIHAEIALIGASGAIAGIVVGYAMLHPCAKVTVLAFAIPLRISAYWVMAIFALVQFIHLGSASESEIAYWCHVGGMLGGAVLLPVMRPAGVKLFQCLGEELKQPAPPLRDAARLPGASQGQPLR
jgi:membrane associated rhomboid family serine protease